MHEDSGRERGEGKSKEVGRSKSDRLQGRHIETKPMHLSASDSVSHVCDNQMWRHILVGADEGGGDASHGMNAKHDDCCYAVRRDSSGASTSSRDALQRADSDLRACGPCHRRRDGAAGTPELIRRRHHRRAASLSVMTKGRAEQPEDGPGRPARLA